MLRFVWRRMISKKWMILALLMGDILLISIAASSPMYQAAVLQRTLSRSLAGYLESKNIYPAQFAVTGNLLTRDSDLYAAADAVVAQIPETMGVDAICAVRHTSIAGSKMNPRLTRDDGKTASAAIGTMTDLSAHVTLVAGRMYADAPDENGVIEAVVSQQALIQLKLLLGEEIEFPAVTDAQEKPLVLRVVGVIAEDGNADGYWVRSPNGYKDELFIAPALFDRLFIVDGTLRYSTNATWYTLLDYPAIRAADAGHMRASLARIAAQMEEISAFTYRSTLTDTLEAYLVTEKKVRVTLWVLEVPVFLLLAAFLFMVSREMLAMEEDEIAVFKSRGASRGQLIGIYLLQSVFLALLALAIGVPLGEFLTRVIGASNAFLEFVSRRALPVAVDAQTLLFAGGAALFSVAAMVLPVIRRANVTIVSRKRRKNGRSQTPLWQKLGVDVLTLGVSLYALYTFHQQREQLAARVVEGASLDPLIFLSSSLFMLGAGLLAVRLLPGLVFLVYRLFRRVWSPALYAALTGVLRGRRQQGFIMVFLVLTIALGIFNADAARTINSNEEENIRYAAGADVVLAEIWENNAAQVEMDSSIELTYTEPDFGAYEQLAGVRSLAKVLTDSVTMSTDGGTLSGVRLMGINTKTFGETAWFKDGLLPHHINRYLNAISQNSRAVLVSQNFADDYGYHTGDTITYKSSGGAAERGIIYGFVSYFPSYIPVSYEKGTDGLYRETEKYLIVAHLSQLQADWGVTPYEIWIRTENSSAFLYDFAQATGRMYRKFVDAAAQVTALKNDAVFQGTNGILTVGFIVVVLLCAVGFLIYWVLSIRARTLQFGIFRAMGMSMREVFTMLIAEQFCVSALSIATGVLVGKLTTRLFMPLIQLAYSASDSALPLHVVSQGGDMLRLAAVVGGMLVCCMTVLVVIIRRMKIAQALKLGED